MATINFLKRKDSKNAGALGSVISYCAQEYKTELKNTGVRLISGVNCIAERAFKDFMDTKKQFNKTDGVQFYYAIQSFEEETNIEPMLAHQIAMEWVEKCYPGYQALVCTHMDTDNIHSHIIINSVSSLDGHKIHQNKNDIERVRYVNDQLCMKYGLPICQPKKKVQGVNSNAMLYAKSKMDFIKLMNKKGYRVVWTNNRYTILYQCPNGKRCRDFKLHEDKYLKGAMENEFKKRKEFLRKYEGYDETGTDASDLHSNNREKLGKSYQSAGTSNINNGTATRHTANDDYNRTDGRFDKQSDREYANLHRETRINNGETQQSYESNRIGFQQVSHKTDERTEGRNQENDEGDILTGWENEREFFQQSFYGERAYERHNAQAKDNQLGADSNASLITWSINFMGNFADLLSTNNRSYRRKKIKLSKKNIRKRQAKGQKTSGYEEYDDYDYTLSM